MGSPSVCSHQATGGELYSGIAQSCARLTGQTSGLPQILSYRRKLTSHQSRRTTDLLGGVPGLSSRPQRPYFVAGQATTRHPCVYMHPWPIFPPMVLANFITDGNTPCAFGLLK